MSDFETAELIGERVQSSQNDYKSTNKLLYFKFEINKINYLISLNDVIEIKNTNLITPLLLPSAAKERIYGVFYYQHEIIPVYKLNIKRDNNGTKIYVSDNKAKFDQQDYHNLIITRKESYYSLIINDIKNTEIIDINFTKMNNQQKDYEVIDINRIINKLKSGTA